MRGRRMLPRPERRRERDRRYGSLSRWSHLETRGVFEFRYHLDGQQLMKILKVEEEYELDG